MSRTYKDSSKDRQPRSRSGRGRPRNISVRAVRRDPPDLRRLSRAIIELAVAQAEADAEAAKGTNASTSNESNASPEDADGDG